MLAAPAISSSCGLVVIKNREGGLRAAVRHPQQVRYPVEVRLVVAEGEVAPDDAMMMAGLSGT